MTSPSLCIECKQNPQEHNQYCYECASRIIIDFKILQAKKESLKNIKKGLMGVTLCYGKKHIGNKTVEIDGYSRKEVIKLLEKELSS